MWPIVCEGPDRAKGKLTRIGLFGAFTALGAELQVIVNGIAEGLHDLADRVPSNVMTSRSPITRPERTCDSSSSFTMPVYPLYFMSLILLIRRRGFPVV